MSSSNALLWALCAASAGCAASTQAGPVVDRCPIAITRAEEEGALPDDLDQVGRAWAVRLFDAQGRCHRVTFAAPVRSEIGPCGARATLARCDDPTRAIAQYKLVINTCPTRRSCDEMVPATLEGTYGQEPAACAGRDLSQLAPDGSRLTVGTEGAVFVAHAPDRAQGSLPFDSLVLRVGGRLPASAELNRACRSESVTVDVARGR